MRNRRTAWIARLAASVMLLWCARSVADEVNWATRQAAQLTRMASTIVKEGRPQSAVRHLIEALRFDASYQPAYLELASVYEHIGDYQEAERTYSVAIDRVPGFTAAYIARARLHARRGDTNGFLSDMRSAVALDGANVELLEELNAAYIQTNAMPAALATSRRIELQLLENGAADEQRMRARVRVIALMRIVKEADPVVVGREGRGSVRNAVWICGTRKR